MSQDVQINKNFLCYVAAILNMTVNKHCFIEANAKLLLGIQNVPGSKPDTGSPD